MRCEVSSQVIAAVLTEAERAHPLECCGILLGADDHIVAALPARNVHPAPATHFEIDPAILIAAHRAAREGGPQVVGYYHSHPVGSTTPSAIDRAQAAHDGAIWAIACGGEIGWWRDLADGFVPVSPSIASA